MKIDVNQIGSQRAIQDPADAMKRAMGTYDDAAQKMSQSDKVDFLPKAPDPQPMRVTGRGSGSR